jgi:acylpyruvate hydrolase
VKLLHFNDAGESRAGIAVAEQVVDIATAVDELQLDGHPTFDRGRLSAVDDILESPGLMALVRGLNDRLCAEPDTLMALAAAGRTRPLGQTELLSPITRPGKIIGVALNFVSHANEAEREMPEYPTLFMKPGTTVNAPDGPITIPRVTSRIDYEGELAVVIGRTARYVDEDHALDFVAGYAVSNDVSARDYQFRTNQIMQGKAFDGFMPIGPWLTTIDEVPDVSDLVLTTHVNGEPRQQASLNEMVFSVEHLVSYASDIMTLKPGDIILAGTPAGIGAGLSPRRWLRAGDNVRIEITGLGVLECAVQDELSHEDEATEPDLASAT